ncbi:uncharacterized [Tachysurus ichikawai]
MATVLVKVGGDRQHGGWGEGTEYADGLIGVEKVVEGIVFFEAGFKPDKPRVWGRGWWGVGRAAWAVLAGSVPACACPLSCALFTSRAVRNLSEPIRGSDGIRQRRLRLDKMTRSFGCYTSKTI